MLPKKGRRNIIVDDVLYHYMVKGYVHIVIQNTETQEMFFSGEEWNPKWKQKMTPKMVRTIIENHNG